MTMIKTTMTIDTSQLMRIPWGWLLLLTWIAFSERIVLQAFDALPDLVSTIWVIATLPRVYDIHRNEASQDYD